MRIHSGLSYNGIWIVTIVYKISDIKWRSVLKSLGHMRIHSGLLFNYEKNTIYNKYKDKSAVVSIIKRVQAVFIGQR